MTHDGEVFLGGIQGMISFWEKKLHFTPKSYNIILSRLFVNGKEVVPGDESGILEQSICHTPEISLKANQSMFSIEYATSTSSLPTEMKFSIAWRVSQTNGTILTGSKR